MQACLRTPAWPGSQDPWVPSPLWEGVVHLPLTCTVSLSPQIYSQPGSPAPSHSHTDIHTAAWGAWPRQGRREVYLLPFPGGSEPGSPRRGPKASCPLPRESRLGTARESGRAMSVSILRGMEGPRTQTQWLGGAAGLFIHPDSESGEVSRGSQWWAGLKQRAWGPTAGTRQATANAL